MHHIGSSRLREVGILGPAIDHQKSLVAMLSGHVRSLTVLPDSHSHIYNKASGFRPRIGRAIDQLWRTRNPEYLEYLCQQIDKARTEMVLAYWGTNPLSDLFALRKLRPQLKLVLMVLCHPLSLDSLGVARQQWMMRRAATVLDGFLFPSIDMAEFFEKTVFTNRRPPWAILPPCWPMSFQSRDRAERVSNAPNLAFIGRTDLSHRTVHAADDIRPLMQGILDVGIELHHGWSWETDTYHPMRRPFKALAQLDLIAMLGGYDASLIVYNIEACARNERFRYTVPDRLITSVAAGVPIAIPANGYDGAKSYLCNYPAVLTFESPMDLKRQLSDREQVSALRDAAWAARQRYCAEVQAPRLLAFLEGLF